MKTGSHRVHVFLIFRPSSVIEIIATYLPVETEHRSARHYLDIDHQVVYSLVKFPDGVKFEILVKDQAFYVVYVCGLGHSYHGAAHIFYGVVYRDIQLAIQSGHLRVGRRETEFHTHLVPYRDSIDQFVMIEIDAIA